MHKLTLSGDLEAPVPVNGGQDMLPGHSYLATNAFAGAMLTCREPVTIKGEQWTLNQFLTAEPWTPPKRDFDNSMRAGRLWLVRGGGYGDLLALTPLIRALRAKYPQSIIKVAMGKQYNGIYDGLGIREKMLPIDMEGIGLLDYVCSFEEVVEGSPQARRTHIAQLFADRLGIDLQGDHEPDYIISDDEREWAAETCPKTRKRIGVQFMASCLIRSYPYIHEVIESLVGLDLEVLLFGKPGHVQVKEKYENLVNLMEQNLSFRQSAAVLETCDCVIAPDSAFQHLASALKVPCVALFGPFPAELRISGDRCEALQGRAECSPCFHHPRRFDEFPAWGPCVKLGYCKAMAQITPKDVIDTAISLCSPIIQADFAKP